MPGLTAKQRLERMTASASEPALSSDEVDDLLAQFQKTDADGVNPGEDDYEPTYNLRAAAAEGWRWKAAKATELVSADLDGDRMSSNQVFEHCQEMIKHYSASSATVSTL